MSQQASTLEFLRRRIADADEQIKRLEIQLRVKNHLIEGYQMRAARLQVWLEDRGLQGPDL